MNTLLRKTAAAVWFCAALCTAAIPLHGQAAPKQVTLFTMQLKPVYTDYMEKVIAGFEKENPGVRVKWLDYPAQGFETKILSLIVGGEGPDVLNLPLQYMITLDNRGLLLPLDDQLTTEQKSRYVTAVVDEGCKVRGRLVAVPWYLATPVNMVNKQLMKDAGLDPEKPPQTLDELFSMSRQIKERTGAFGFMTPLTEDGALKSIMASSGVQLTNPEMTKAAFNTPEAVRIITEYKKLFDEKVIPRESITGAHRDAIRLHQTGKTAFFVSGAQFLLTMKKESPDVYANTGIGNMPPIPPDNKYLVELQNISVYAKSPNPREAVDLALWITNARNQLEFAKLVTIFPSVEEALDDPYFSQPGDAPEDMARNIGAQQLRRPTALIPPLPSLGRLNRAMDDATRSIMLRNVPVEEALAKAEQQWNEILAKPE